MTAPQISVREARTADQIETVKVLFAEYRAWLVAHREVTNFPDSVLRRGLALFDAEQSGLPGDYVSPKGALFLAFEGRTPIGLAALRYHKGRTAEFKRLYVRPACRSAGVGRRLTVRALQRARQLGYRRVVLDTLPRMVRAIALYRKLGFRRIDPFWDHPVPTALFFELDLREGRQRPPSGLRPSRPTRPVKKQSRKSTTVT
ncbi:MAG: GNAT family N-acetyltransferase [Thermoplasmata archaeon]|nr:GNAT family N-acetyltransferase [Thermoplasmata archaeon]